MTPWTCMCCLWDKRPLVQQGPQGHTGHAGEPGEPGQTVSKYSKKIFWSGVNKSSLICEILNSFLLCQGPRWSSRPPWTSWQSWRGRMYTPPVSTNTFLIFFFFFCGCLLKWPVDSQGNNGRPGKPGDRGAPGPQVRHFDRSIGLKHETLNTNRQ